MGCDVNGCERPGRYKRGLCASHYDRLRQHGDPLGGRAHVGEPPQDRLLRTGWTTVIRNPEFGECWEWNGKRGDWGHGKINLPIINGDRSGGTVAQAHRIAYEHFVGPIPDGMLIRHKCDNPPCVNPAHLEPGTPADNTGDAVARGRMARGSGSGASKLTEKDVLEIMEKLDSGATCAEVAQIYRCSESNIYMIKNGKTWGWLTNPEAP